MGKYVGRRTRRRGRALTPRCTWAHAGRRVRPTPPLGGSRVHQVDARSELRTPSLTAATAPPASVLQAVDARTWGMLALLCFVYGLNFLDRQLLSILAKPIQDSLHVTDGQLGLIGGLYFAFFYCFIAVPVGWFADKTNRVTVLSLACAVWSGAPMCCGFAATYPQLVAARMTGGFGEAGGVPPSYALITDTFPPGRRGMALCIYNLG